MTLVAVIYFAIVAAHQLTPYMALAGSRPGAARLVRRGWLLLLMLVVIAGGYLGLHYGLISQSSAAFSAAERCRERIRCADISPSRR